MDERQTYNPMSCHEKVPLACHAERSEASPVRGRDAAGDGDASLRSA